jgi:hypothetical protein
MPKNEPGLESYNWWISICSIVDDIDNDRALEQYLHFGGFINGYGPFSDGTMRILINSNFNGNITNEDLKTVVKIVEEYAEKEGIKSVPIVFIISGPVSPTEGEYQETPKANYTLYQTRHRPLVGGVMFSTVDSSGPRSSGSIGFMAKDNETGDYGFVTAAHIFGFTNRDVHQPIYNAFLPFRSRIGTSDIAYTNTDVVFVPYQNVEAKIFYQNETSSGTYTVGGYFNEMIIGEEVTKSGYVTGIQNATIVGYYSNMNMTNAGWAKYDYPRFEKVGRLDANILENGDSGSVVFQIQEDGKAYIVGIAFASGDGMTYFIPSHTLCDQLGITPLIY